MDRLADLPPLSSDSEDDGDDISIDQQEQFIIVEDGSLEPSTPRPSSPPVDQQRDRDQTHIIVPFPSKSAGAPITAPTLRHSQYDAYQALFGDSVYAPFTSETDWWIAQWAKTQGPSSTAVNELLAFVCTLFHVLVQFYLFCISCMESSVSHTRIHESSTPSLMACRTGHFSDVRKLKSQEEL